MKFQIISIVFTLIIAASPTPVRAAEGALGTWLSGKAIPEIVEALSRHPRFRGETIEIGPLHAAQPTAHGNLLTADIEREVADALLDVSGIRLRSGRQQQCDDKTGVYLGISVRPVRSNRYHVALRFLDQQEGIWITGVGSAWQGPLNSAQKRALATIQIEPGAGTSKLPLNDSERVAQALATELSCQSRRAGLLPSTPWQLTPSDNAQVNAVAAALLRRAPELFSGGGAATMVEFQLDSQAGRLNLLSQTSALVSVAVITQAGAVDAPTPQSEDVHVDARRVAATGVCSRQSSRECLEVAITTGLPAYTFAFLTYEQGGKHRVQSLNCGSTIGASNGVRRVRVAIDDDVDAGAVGVYAIATSDGQLAQRLSQQLSGAHCKHRGEQRWIDDLAEVVNHPAASWDSQQVDLGSHAWAAR